MDLKQFNALLAVADTGSFSAAARALHTVQSNISTHVAHLERELDATLVDRSTGALTEEGQLVASRARRISAEITALTSDISSLNDEVAGVTKLGIIGTAARWLVPFLVDTMSRRHPKVRMIVVDATTSSLLLQLHSGLLDQAIVGLPLDDPDVRVDALFNEDRVLVAPGGHHLYGRKSLQLSDLDGEPLLLEPTGTAFRDLLDEQCAQEGVHLHARAEIDGMRLLASLAFQGFGAAILPASAAPGWIGGNWMRIPVEGLPGRSVGLATRKRGLLSIPAKAVREAVHDVILSEGPSQPGIHPTFSLPS